MDLRAFRRSEHSVRVGNQQFVIHKPYWGHAEVELDGQLLTKDAYGNLVCPDGRGGRRKVSVTFDVRQLSPALNVDGTRYLTLSLLPWHLRLALLLLVAVSVVTGVGVLLGLAFAWGIAVACRKLSPGPAAVTAISAAVTAGAAWGAYTSWN